MPKTTLEREIAVAISDVTRLLRTYADQQVRPYGMTKAQWFILSRIQRTEGIRQSELAEEADLQPITVTRLVDRLVESGMIERRPDPDDRRAKRLFLTPAATPMLEQLLVLGRTLMENVLEGLSGPARQELLANLLTMKNNVRNAIAERSDEGESAEEQTYG
jgi:MarR family transcriptional regulator, transcriptional regulator for hemolysin